MDEEERLILEEEVEEKKIKYKEEQQKIVEVEAKRKEDEEVEKERQNKLGEAHNIPTTPSVSIVDITPQECTPLMAIPRNLSFSS
jgi:hydroxymethylpyrimidine pyrophosphatase-like HAD family hydrolase